ncbi:MAG: hypothetical protein OQK55_03265 [Thermoanaerobaculales bacterium]|nr:hypothetical protein [Thermoanaerobaculales bacterium]
MRSSKVFAVGCVALLLAGTAAANIGSFSFSHSVLPVGSGRVDFTLTSSTYGASTTRGYFEGIANRVYIYNTYASSYDTDYNYRPALTQYSTSGPPYGMRLTSNFSFTGLPPGVYGYLAMGAAYYRTYTTYPYYTYTWIPATYDYTYGTALVGVDVPTAGQFGLMLLGLALAASGVILLRRV